METKSLENIAVKEIAAGANEAFSDYIIPMPVTEESLTYIIARDSVDLKMSAGVFDDGKLVALILTGMGERDGVKTAYNAMTGVIPSHRNRRLVYQMYDFMVPKLKAAGVKRGALEFIGGNEKAQKAYTRVGYKTARIFQKYTGALDVKTAAHGFTARELKTCDWDKMKSFWSRPPIWQDSQHAVENVRGKMAVVGVFDGEKLIGYTAFNPVTKRFAQYAVDKNYRRKGAATTLFKHVQDNYCKDIAVIFAQDTNAIENAFLKKIGLKEDKMLHEMTIEFK